MPVVGHWDVGVDVAVFAYGDFPAVLEVAIPIGIGEEAGLAIVAAWGGMPGNAW